ncbi:MAG: acyl esterase [Pedobacter sp.]|nr:MAG: acyl esterase [Pedobacter sp.]
MDNILDIAKSIQASEYAFEFSICTLVTRKQEYNEMLQSFLNKGFSTEDCEYLFIDNSTNCTFDAYQGLNIFLQQAKGKYIILCHQDVLVHDQDRAHLSKCINEIEERDKNWGILANAGGINLKWIATNLTQGNGNVIKEKFLPLQTKTVDENFIIVKSSANLTLSNDLSGFHLYGTDLCILADILGYNAYIIDFNLTHKSDGNADQSFYAQKRAMITKYRHALRSRFLCTTITRFYISGNWFTAIIYDTMLIKFFVKQYYKFFKTKKSYHLK